MVQSPTNEKRSSRRSARRDGSWEERIEIITSNTLANVSERGKRYRTKTSICRSKIPILWSLSRRDHFQTQPPFIPPARRKSDLHSNGDLGKATRNNGLVALGPHRCSIHGPVANTRKKLEMTSQQTLFHRINRERWESQTAKCSDYVLCSAHGMVSAYHNWQKKTRRFGIENEHVWFLVFSTHYARNMSFCRLEKVSTCIFFASRQENCYLYCLLLFGNAGPTARHARITLLKLK